MPCSETVEPSENRAGASSACLSLTPLHFWKDGKRCVGFPSILRQESFQVYLNDACLTSLSPANYQGKPINLLLSTNLPFSPCLLKRWLRLSVLSALRDTFFTTLHHNHSVGDLPSLSLNPKALLEFYVSVGCLE